MFQETHNQSRAMPLQLPTCVPLPLLKGVDLELQLGGRVAPDRSLDGYDTFVDVFRALK